LSHARSALDKIQPWQNTPQWQFIDSSLRGKSNEVATLALQDARKLAQANDLAAAVRLIEPAIDLAGADLKPQAEQLLQIWRAQLETAARLAAEAEAWSELSRLSQAGRYLEAWRGLQEFEQEYPDSSRLAQRDAIRSRLRPLVDTAIGAAFRQLDAQAAARNWPAYRETADMLAAAPLSPTEQQRTPAIQQQLEKLTAEANRLFRETYEHRRRYSGNETSVIELIKSLPQVLQLDPDQVEAKELFPRVQEHGKRRAQALLLSARSKLRFASSKGQVRDLLQRASLLDPGGEYGKDALNLLQTLDVPAPTK
jgi:hypothetical protein